MTWKPKVLPQQTPETEPFWTAAAEETLLLRECNNCDLISYYPRALCPGCLSDDVSWTEAAGIGSLYSFTVVHQVQGWDAADLPLVIGYVELDEGPRILTNIIDCQPDALAVGMAVEVTFIPAQNGDISIPLFTPVHSTE